MGAVILAPDDVRPFPVTALRADVLREVGGRWEVWSESEPRRKLAGPYATRAEAEKRLRAIDWYKAHPGAHRKDAGAAADLVALARAHRLMHAIDKTARPAAGRVPRQLPPTAIMVRYAQSLLAIVSHARRVYEPLLKALPGLVEQAGAGRKTDAQRDDAPGERALARGAANRGDAQRDDAPGERARQLAADAAKHFRDTVRAPDLERIARKVAGETQSWNKEQIRRQVRAVVGVDPVFRDKRLAPMVDDFAHHNAALIERLPERLHADVQEIVTRGLRAGTHVDELQDELEERFGITERHARLIARDQVGKLTGQLNRVRQQDLGIERYRWMTVQDERVRGDPAGKYPKAEPSHFALHGKPFTWGGDEPVDDEGEVMEPGSDYQCFPGSTPVSSDAPVTRAFRRWYRGEGSVLLTEDGRRLTSTPNHPVLTTTGWKAAQLVEIGEYLVQAQPQGCELGVLDQEHRNQTTIEEVFRTLAPFGRLATTRGGRFHGDAAFDEQVDVVRVDRSLVLELDSSISQRLCEYVLTLADESRLRPRPLGALFGRVNASATRLVRGGGKLLAFVTGHRGVTEEHSLGPIARLDALLNQARAHVGTRDVEVLRDLFHAPSAGVQLADHLARVVAGVVGRALVPGSRLHAPSAEEFAEAVRIDAQNTRRLSECVGDKKLLRVVEKRVCELAAHVYNLETTASWYVACGLVVHNCRCYAEPIFDGLLDAIEGDDEDEPDEGDE